MTSQKSAILACGVGSDR